MICRMIRLRLLTGLHFNVGRIFEQRGYPAPNRRVQFLSANTVSWAAVLSPLRRDAAVIARFAAKNVIGFQCAAAVKALGKAAAKQETFGKRIAPNRLFLVSLQPLVGSTERFVINQARAGSLWQCYALGFRSIR